MRVLFVDDEPRVLDGIETALVFEGEDIVARFARSGTEAIELLDAEPFDVVVTDMKMPGLSGAEVLEAARARHPSTARVVLSGEVDEELASRAMALTHEYVSKPCDAENLLEIVRKVYDTAHSLDSPIITELVGSMTNLPSQPRVFHQIQARLDAGHGPASIAQVVESDIATATAVLRTANSAFYGFRTPARSIQEAVTRLGGHVVAGIALNTELAADAPPRVLREIEILNALACDVSRIVRAMIGEERPEASLAALLRSIGVVVLQANLPERFRPIQEHFNRTGRVDDEAERRILGAGHAEIGAYVLRMWHVDPLVVEIVRHHRRVEEAGPEAAPIIHAIAAADAALGSHRERPHWLDPEWLARAEAVIEKDEL